MVLGNGTKISSACGTWAFDVCRTKPFVSLCETPVRIGRKILDHAFVMIDMLATIVFGNIACVLLLIGFFVIDIYIIRRPNYLVTRLEFNQVDDAGSVDLCTVVISVGIRKWRQS